MTAFIDTIVTAHITDRKYNMVYAAAYVTRADRFGAFKFAQVTREGATIDEAVALAVEACQEDLTRNGSPRTSVIQHKGRLNKDRFELRMF